MFNKAQVRQRQPRAEATIYSADLEEMKATFFLLSLQTVDSINLQQDQVVLNLAPRAALTYFTRRDPEYTAPGVDDIFDWADLIEPNDIVAVKLYDEALAWTPNNEYLQNYGIYLVDRVSVRMGFAAGGNAQRMIMIVGRGFGKVFTEHTLARFPSIGGDWGAVKLPTEGDVTREDIEEVAEENAREQTKAVKELGIIPSICGSLTYTLWLAGEKGGYVGPLDKILRNVLRNDAGLTDGMPLLFGNAFMKLRYGIATKDENGNPTRTYFNLVDLLDLTSNIHVRDGCGIDSVDVFGLTGQEQGPILGLLRSIAAPPFYEIFIRVIPQNTDDAYLKLKAYLCIRSCPFESIKTGDVNYSPESLVTYEDSGYFVYQPFWYLKDGNIPTECVGLQEPRIPTVEAWEIINFDIGRSDADTFTFFSGSGNSELVPMPMILESLIPGFYPGPFPDFSGGTGKEDATNPEVSEWMEQHRQIQDRNGPKGTDSGTACLRNLPSPDDMKSVYSKIRGIFPGGEAIGASHRFGVKVMQVQNRFVPKELLEHKDEDDPDPDGKCAAKLLFQQFALLADWFSMNPHYMSGKLTIAGRTDIMKGCWTEVNVSASGRSDLDQFIGGKDKARRLRFYVEQVDQSYQFGGNWTTTLTVTRGEYVIE